MINVTKTYLPNKEKYKKKVDEIYKNGWVTNRGPLVRELEKRLEEFLGAKNVVLVANGTVALEIAYRTLGVGGFAITTPFSFVATTSSLVTNGILPVFADIDKETLNIDVDKIEEKITPRTSAIVPTHVFGNACDIEGIDEIARRHRLKVIYDAAHAFGVSYKNRNIVNYGDISVMSFHATKVFHCIEGGALVINSNELAEKARYLINFGIQDAERIPHLGTNAKMNEFEAAMGHCVLDDIDSIILSRKEMYQKYKSEISSSVNFQKISEDSENSYNYFPVILSDKSKVLKIMSEMKKRDINPRRYFYPSLDTLDYIEPKQYCPNSRDIAERIICLPMYYGLEPREQDLIIKTIGENI